MREFFNVLLSTISLLTIFPLSMCDAVNTAAVSFAPAGPADTPGAVIPKAIPAKLSLPSKATGRVPAVNMSVVECNVPCHSALGKKLIEHADFRNAHRAPLNRSDLSVVEIFFEIFAQRPRLDESDADCSQ